MSTSGSPRVLVVGDALLDRDWTGQANRLCPDSFGPVVNLEIEACRPGGAALAALAAASIGAHAGLLSALGEDAAGTELQSLLAPAGVRLMDLGLRGATPEKIRLRVGSATMARLDRNADPAGSGPLTPDGMAALRRAHGVLLSDYGRGFISHVLGDQLEARPAASRKSRRSLPGIRAGTPVVWDPHVRSSRPPVALALATPNRAEATHFCGETSAGLAAEKLARMWSCPVAVTCGSEGAYWSRHGEGARRHRVRPVEGDPCGAGDWFAAGAATALARGRNLEEAIDAGCDAAASWISNSWTSTERCPRPQVLVATSGCFDVLHVGHTEMLRHARSLGDRLVVLLNSDRSVRRLKGPSRPFNSEADRAAVLRGLSAVDEVVIFDEPTPCAALERLRPALFVKGGDYEGEPIPEKSVLEQWGGRLVTGPYIEGRSTTRLLQLARVAE